MTEESKDAVLGRLMREYRENKEHIGRLGAEAGRWGKRLEEMGRALQSGPEGVIFSGLGLDARLRRLFDFTHQDLDVERLTSLTNDYRAAIEVRRRLETDIKQLGYSTP
jgi:hypothetical protein